MLLAEAFALLALDPDGTVARGMSNQPAAAVGVTGALQALAATAAATAVIAGSG